ncbi:olfactory receptor 2K2-like [Megalops cyprinoides]|uniref:olfactory receptor 2K2-like n=1 Tax=Megalops cyprinoides TaxID=118141 RepID=UPI0018655825|nr:olfactory receptor 2K2-like [Megalops cyprinoides]
MENSSTVKFFSLSGLQETRSNKSVYFTFTFLFYLIIIFVNLTLIVIIILEKGLHEPMYIFLCNLCVNVLYGTAGFYPKLLLDLLSDVHVISYDGCFTQGYVIYSSVMCEITILTVMAYDRYVAICRPLQYHTIMTPLTVGKLLSFAWSYPLLTSAGALILALRIPLCGSYIDKLFCDNGSILKLSCVSTVTNMTYSYILVLGQLSQLFWIIYSYCHIVKTCLKSREGRIKFTQTCLPHLLTMINFAIATLFDHMYSRYGSQNLAPSLRNAMILQFLIIPPLFNPIIYGLNLQKIRRRLFRLCEKNKVTQMQ